MYKRQFQSSQKVAATKTSHEKLIEFLEKSWLIILSLTSVNIDGGGAGEIAEALKVNTSLTSLHLDDNNIGDQGARSLAEARKSNISLTSPLS